MKWQTVVGEAISLPQIQQPFPAQGDFPSAPMEVREIHANRFVCHLAGHMEKARPLPTSSREPRWPLLPGNLDPKVEVAVPLLKQVVEHSVPPRGPMSS